MAIGEEGEEAKDKRCCQEGKRPEEFIDEAESSRRVGRYRI
jgi:hypothetical protein